MDDHKKIQDDIESKVQRFIELVVYFLIVVGFEFLISYLFPYTTLAGLICIPITLIVAGVSTYLLFKFKKTVQGKQQFRKKAFITFSIGFFILLLMHPQERESPLEQIINCSKAYINYNKVNYNSFEKLNKQERISYLYKYKNYLPNHIVLLSFYEKDDNAIEHNRTYSINYRKDSSIEYNQSLLSIEMTDSTTLITENKLNKKHKLNGFFVNLFDRGTYSAENIYDDFYIETDLLNLDTGIEKLYYFILSITRRKASEKIIGKSY